MKKTFRSNQKHFTCEHCFEIIHPKCINYLNINQSGSCPDCLSAELPFYRTNFLNSSVELLQQQSEQQIRQSQLLHDFDPYFEMLDQNRNCTSIVYLNTQCLSSTLDEFDVMLNKYEFDIFGYNLQYANGDNKWGEDVGVYIKEIFTYTEPKDIINLDKSTEHY